MSLKKIIVKLAFGSLQLLRKSYNFLDSVLSGFWLGVFCNKTLDLFDDYHYSRSEKYHTDSYNFSGLKRWEAERVERFFVKGRKILLTAAGAGRETLALSSLGYEVDSYECNRDLVDYGNSFLKRHGNNIEIKYLPRNSVPFKNKVYDGVIIGWGAYSHIRTPGSRIEFLLKLKDCLKIEAPLMISFVTRAGSSRQDRIVKGIANLFRRLSGREKVEEGDRLFSYFIHFFTEEEVRAEIQKAGYKVLDYYDIEYGCIIASVGGTGL